MASNGQLALPDQARRAIAQTKTLFVDGLKKVLRDEGLQVSGVKAELQHRIIDHIQDLQNAGDISGMNRVLQRVQNPRGLPSGYSPTNINGTPPSSLSPQCSTSMRQPFHSTFTMAPSSSNSGHITFKDSPFYTVVKSLTPVLECRARENTRDTVNASVALTNEVAEQLQDDQNYRVMVFCAADNNHPPYAQSEITFPHQVELKCNLDEVKANLRGLKNKPGSTRPADITTFMRKKGGYPNSVQMTYALTKTETLPTQKFYMVVNLVQKRPVDELVIRLKQGKIIGKERVIQEMQRKAQDTDIVATSIVMSLKCPLSTLRIDTPCRSIGCAHNQCFDAASYLQLQEQAPTWTCPVCNKYAPFEVLAVDLYVDSILKSTSRNEEQVTIEPNGTWSKHSTSDGSSRNGNPTPEDDDDEDLVELPDSRVTSLRQQATLPMAYAGTPSSSSREASLASPASRPGKRPASEVIDLTLDDDDDAPLAKIKRSSTSTEFQRARYHEGFSFPLPRQHSQGYQPFYEDAPL